MSTARRKVGKRISPKNRRAIIDAFDEEFRAAGLPSYEEMLTQIGEAIDTNDMKESVKNAFLLGVRKKIDESPDLTPEGLSDALAAIRGKLRYMIRPEFSRSVEQLKKELPRKPGPGRGKALSPEKEVTVCDSVVTLIRQKVPYPVILKRIGQKFGVSGRTVQRIWQRRGEIHPRKETLDS